MNKKVLFVLPLFAMLLVGCKDNSSQEPEFDPFMIGDNLEVINSTEAQLIANKAYNNLIYASSLKKNTVSTTDDTNFYTNAFASRATNSKTTVETDANFYTDKITTSRVIKNTNKVGNDVVEESSSSSSTEWYGIKPVEQGETPSANYSLLRKTIDDYGGNKSERYRVVTDDFSTKTNASIIWNRYIVESISSGYLTDVNISYSPRFTYVRDKKHIVGYLAETSVSVESSKIAPGKADISYVKRVDNLSVIDFYEDSLNGIGWTIKSISKKRIESYLTSVDGKESDPIEVFRQENVTSLVYSTKRQKGGDLPQFIVETVQPFFISKFVINEIDEEHSELVYDSAYRLENNNAYYLLVEDNFKGHAYYLEQRLSVGYYAFFDDEESGEYEKWGYDDIISNQYPNYIVNPLAASEGELNPILEGHTKLFYIAEEATFLFRIVFDENMEEASEFTVAVFAR